MQLYDLSFSPYSARVRIAVRLKDLPVRIVAPPHALPSDDFKAKFPLGKIPVLLLDNGVNLPESWVILEYLEDCHDQPPLRPADPLGKAQMRLLGRFADLYLGPALFPLFGELRQPSGDAAKVSAALTQTRAELVKLERLLAELPPFHERALHLGDIGLLTTMFYVLAVTPWFGLADALEPQPGVRQWWDAVRQVAAVHQTLDEMDQGFRAFLRQIGKLPEGKL